MKNIMLSTTIAASLIAALASAALAQEAAAPMFRDKADPMELRASSFIGMRVYRSETALAADEMAGKPPEWDDIGEINDVILARDGAIEAVLVDIGGFLGMGERQVAVDMSAIRFVSDGATTDRTDDFFLVMNAAKADFEAAPAYSMLPMATDAPMAAAPARAPMLRDGFALATTGDLTTEKLTGARVYDANDKWIGDVGALVLAESGHITDAVIDVGGFLGMGEKPVALKLADIDILRNAGGDEVRVYVSMTKEQLEKLPTYGG